jgi:hypothetical protein
LGAKAWRRQGAPRRLASWRLVRHRGIRPHRRARADA